MKLIFDGTKKELHPEEPALAGVSKDAARLRNALQAT
jgi:hypothetical protein